ncbi:MAG TPA: hypothetical protein VFV87_05865 [Pirellulaceae bacterium]|nr:hypothetical protein [Pirellulaceae bacterium]
MLFRSALLAIVLSVAGCNMQPMKVCVYIDNSGHEPMLITVDGQEEMTVPSGEVAELKLPPGEHQFLIRAGSETVCDLMRNLEPSQRFGVARKYLFDPYKNHRYQTYYAQYGESRLGDLMESTLFSFQTDPDAQLQYVYKQLLKEIDLVPSDAWNDVTGVDYVLTAPPDEIYTSSMEKRRVLDRIEPAFYEQFLEAKQVQNPTDEDVEKLGDLLDEVLAQSL